MPWGVNSGWISENSGWGRAAASSWTPASLGSNLTGWWDGFSTNGTSADYCYTDAGVTPCTNSTLVAQWNDRSGLGHNITASGSQRATWVTATAYNSKPGLNFSAVGTNAMGTAFQVIPSNASTFSLFAVVQLTSSASTNGRLVAVTSAANGLTNDWDNTSSIALTRVTTNAQIQTDCNNLFSTANAVTYATNFRVGIVYNGTTGTVYINGVAGNSISVTPTLAANIGIIIGDGFGGGNGSYWDGPILEVFCAKTDISSNASQIESYFTGKWGA